MNAAVEIEQAFKRLPSSEKFELLRRLEEDLADQWDRQFETDVAEGRLEAIAQKAIQEHRAGRSTPFPEDAQ